MTGSGDTNRDVVTRAKAALEGVTEGPWRAVNVGNVHWGVSEGDYSFPTVVHAQCSYDGFGNGSRRDDAEFIAAARSLVPELVAEIERLRAGGPWVEHVEYMNAMKRERDGACICDGNPATTDGPQEDCPWHGREYRYWVDGCASLATEVERIKGDLEVARLRGFEQGCIATAERLGEQ